jgi:hypothetical protein
MSTMERERSLGVHVSMEFLVYDLLGLDQGKGWMQLHLLIERLILRS